MLLEIEGEHVRVFTGLAMRMRLLRILGPVRALRVARLVARHGGPVLGVDWGRRRFLGRALGALAGLLLIRHAGQAAAAPPPPTSGGLPIRRSRRLEGTERAQALQHLQNHPDLKALGLTVPPDDGEFPLVIAHELADGNTLTTAGWPIEGQEIVVALLFARIARVSLGHEPAAYVKSMAMRVRIEDQTARLQTLSVNGKSVTKRYPSQMTAQQNCPGCSVSWEQVVCGCTSWNTNCLISCGLNTAACSVVCLRCIVMKDPWACAGCVICAMSSIWCFGLCCNAIQCGCGSCPPGP